MKVTAIAVTYGRKINLQNFNSAHVEVSVWADLEDGEVFVQVESELRRQCRDAVRQEFQRLVKAGNNEPTLTT